MWSDFFKGRVAVKRFYSIAVIALFFLYLGSPLAAPIRLVGDDGAPPHLSLINGEARGTLIDTLKKVGKAAQLDMVFELQPWARSLRTAMTDDVGIIGLSMTPERALIFDFSEPIGFSEIILVVRRGSEFPFQEPKDLKGKLIGAQIGASYGDAIDKEFLKTDYDMYRTDSLPVRLGMLLRNRLDVVIVVTGRAGLQNAIESTPALLSRREDFVVLTKPLIRDPEYLAFRKDLDKKDLLMKINAALRGLK
jgi:polar amino acid transport system substrate-binding protein